MSVSFLRPVVVVALALAVAGTTGVAGQEPAALRVEVQNVSDGTYPYANAILNVEDTSGGDSSLTPENIAVSVNGQSVRVKSVELATSESASLDLLFVMDTSGSMDGAPLANAKGAAKALIGELADGDRVAIISFGDTVVPTLDFTADRQATNGAIDGLMAVGNTALYQATAVSAVKIASSPANRRVVIFLSDGADFGDRSVATREEALAAAGGVGAPYFVIAQGTDLDKPYLQELANVTSGRYLEAPNPQDLESLYVGIGRLLKSQYLVTFDASSVASLPQSDVTVTVSTDADVATAQAIYRPGATFVPDVIISGIEDGDRVEQVRQVLVTVSGEIPASRVVFSMDGVEAADSMTPPYVFSFDPEAFEDGPRRLTVAVEAGGPPITTDIEFVSGPAAATGGGGLPILPIVAVILLAVLGAGGLVFVRARGAGSGGPAIPADQRILPFAPIKRDLPPMPLRGHEEQEPEPESIGEVMGVLISRAGPDLGSEYEVGGRPVSIGSSKRCGVHVNDPDLSGEEARIWVRGNHLMLHRFTKLTTLAADGTVGGWTILDPGDTFEVGQHTFEFRLVEPERRDAGAAMRADVSNVLYDDAPEPQSQRVVPSATPPASSQVQRMAELMPPDNFNS
jgi:Mg-chelatase subunit ChlD